MECNNTFCLWSTFGSCCHEDFLKVEKIVTPNQLDCPASLRRDLQTQLFNLRDECVDLIDQRNMKELIAIKKFILSQREEK